MVPYPSAFPLPPLHPTTPLGDNSDRNYTLTVKSTVVYTARVSDVQVHVASKYKLKRIGICVFSK